MARSHLRHTLTSLDGNEMTKPLRTPLVALLSDWTTTFQTELDLTDQVDDADVAVVAIDRRLNQVAKKVSKEILTIIEDKTPHALYDHYFHGKPLHLFIRPILGKQLAAMRAWIPSLAASENAALKALGVELKALIKEADDAITAKNDAQAALDKFRDIGERCQYINKVNAALKSTYGALSSMPHEKVGLPPSFADDFFLRARVQGEDEAEPTVESVEEEIDDLTAALAAKQEQLATLKVAREKADKQAEAKAAAQAKKALLEKELEAKQKELEALSKELGE